MGGNALKNCSTRRYRREEYFDLCNEVVFKTSYWLPCSFPHVIEAYHNKESFGDMDVIILSDMLPYNYLEIIKEVFEPAELVKNGNCVSFEYKNFQIDFIITPEEEYSTSVRYFSYNDLGNLLGRVAHSMGLKLGHDGLSYNWRVDTYQFRNIVLLKDWKDILPVLGYDYNDYKHGFATLEEIFKFVVKSPYFNKDIYLLRNRNHTSRVRDAKRKTYMDFLDWIETYQETEEQKAYAATRHSISGKDVWLPYLFSKIEGFEAVYSAVNVEWKQAILIKNKFNGDIVKEQLGLEGKELGKFMRYLKDIQKSKDPESNFYKIVLNGAETDIQNEIDRCYQWYKQRIPGVVYE